MELEEPPAALMAAATVNLPAIVLSGGPMLDGNYKGKLAGSGTIVWEARKLLSKGKINYDEFMDMVSAAAPSIGHCNTMGTASSMNSVAEALGMSLPGYAIIPAPYREREQISFDTGKRIVGMVHEDLKPSKIMTRKAFENAVIVASAIGGSSNCTTHLTAIAKHMGIKFDLSNWQKLGHEIPLLVNCQPAGEYLMESFYRAGGIPAIMKELIKNKKIHTNIITVTGKTVKENLKRKIEVNRKVIKTFEESLTENAGFLVLKGNFFSSAIMKTSVISSEFRERYLSDPKHPNVFKGKAVVFEGPEDYHNRINSKKLKITEKSILIIRGCGPVGYPGAAEVVNMQPPDRLLKKGINALPTLGDGRQSGTSESPSILHVSPESAVGGDLAIIKTGDNMCIDLNKRRVDLLISKIEFKKRRKKIKVIKFDNQTPWQEISRSNVGQLEDGACIRSRGLENNLAENFDVTFNKNDEPIPYEKLIDLANQYDGRVVSGWDKFDENFFNKMKGKLKIIATFSVGYDHININSAKEKNIVITNTPDVLNDAVAEITIFLMLAACRKAYEGVNLVKSDNWKKVKIDFVNFVMGQSMTGKTLGIIGLGRIGRIVAKRAKGFGMKIIYHNRNKLSDKLEDGAKYYNTLNSMMPDCDFVSIHTPATSETKNILNSEAINLLPKHAIVINTSRGSTLDDEALIEALQNNKIYAAGLDVFVDEPNVDERYLKLDNCFLLPHIGSSNYETRDAMAMLAVININAFFKNDPLPTKVK